MLKPGQSTQFFWVTPGDTEIDSVVQNSLHVVMVIIELSFCSVKYVYCLPVIDLQHKLKLFFLHWLMFNAFPYLLAQSGTLF